jgi:hypothetical protein
MNLESLLDLRRPAVHYTRRPPRREQMACRFRRLDRKGERRFDEPQRADAPAGAVEIIDRPRPRANGSNRPFPAVRAPTPGCAELANLLRAVGFRDLDGKLSCIMSFGSGGLGPWPDGRRIKSIAGNNQWREAERGLVRAGRQVKAPTLPLRSRVRAPAREGRIEG